MQLRTPGTTLDKKTATKQDAGGHVLLNRTLPPKETTPPWPKAVPLTVCANKGDDA